MVVIKKSAFSAVTMLWYLSDPKLFLSILNQNLGHVVLVMLTIIFSVISHMTASQAQVCFTVSNFVASIVVGF